MNAKPTLTDEQRAALDTRDISIALDAGAGCGKTFVLTERYLSHLDPEVEQDLPALDEVIAITFTNAAAREMRDRIRNKCRERLTDITTKHSTYWRRLRRSLDAARVTTIHAFCSALVRQYAVELGVDPAFRVIDGPSAQTMRSQAIDDTIRQALMRPEGEIDPHVIDAAAELKLPQLRQAVALLCTSAHEAGFESWAERSPSEIVESWLEYYHQEVAPRYAEEFLQRDEIAELLRLIELAQPQTPGLREHFDTVVQTLEEARQSHAPHQVLRQLAPLLKSKHPQTNKNVWNSKDWQEKEDKLAFTSVCQSLVKVLTRQKKTRRQGIVASRR